MEKYTDVITPWIFMQIFLRTRLKGWNPKQRLGSPVKNYNDYCTLYIYLLHSFRVCVSHRRETYKYEVYLLVLNARLTKP